MRIFHPLRSPPVALLWGGLSLSAIGDQLYGVALTWIAVGVLGAGAGYLRALQSLILVLAALGIGGWADRWDQRGSMIRADLARAAVLILLVAAWMATGHPSAGLLIAAVMVLAIGQAVFQPALQTLLPDLVPERALLPAANALLDATDRSARLLGPGLIALLAAILPVMHFMTIDAASFLLSAAALLLIRVMRPNPRPVPRPGVEPVLAGIRRGVAAMRGHPLLGYTLATTGIVNGAWLAAFFLALPLMITHRAGDAGGGLASYGVVIAAYGCTNLAATIVVGSRKLPAQPQFQMFGGTLIVGSGIVLLGLATLLPAEFVIPGFIAAAAFSAIGGPMKDIPLAVLRQTRLDPLDVAAAMRVYLAMSNAGALLAMLLMPLAITHAGVVAVTIACGGALVAVGLVGILRLADWVDSPGVGVMLTWSALLLAAAALLGFALVIMHAGLPGLRRPHWTLAALHGALGVAGLACFLARLAEPGATRTMAQLGPMAVGTLAVAALIGGVAILARIRRRPVPGFVLGVHATVALLGGVIVAACLSV